MSYKILVTGGAGFIGSHLTDELIEQGHEVHVIDNLSTGKLKNINDKATFHLFDLCNSEMTERVLEKIKPDYVFHLAALARIQPSIEDPIRWNDNNTNATLNLLCACHKAGSVKRFVYSSSSSVYGLKNTPPYKETLKVDPLNPYALCKSFGEQYCELFNKLYKLNTVALRYFNVYGPRQVLEGDYATVIGIFLKQKEDNKNITIVGDGTQRRDFTYVKDIVRANIGCINYNGDYQVFNVGTGENYSIKDVAKMIQPDESKHQYGIVRKAEAKETLANSDKIRDLLGWKPQYNLEEGINEILTEL